MNARKSLLVLAIAAGSSAMFAPAPAAAEVYVRIAPPAPRYEVVPAERRGYVWVPGYWNWNGRRYVWVRGHSVRGHRGAHWVPHSWAEDHGRWRMNRGHWDRD